MAMHSQVRACAILVLAMLVMAYAGQPTLKTPSGGKAIVYLRGVPNSASVTINNDPFRLSNTKPITLAPGTIQLRVYSGGTQVLKSFSIKAGEAKVINFKGNQNYSVVDVITDPLGAEVSIDEKKSGVTPFIDSLVEPGSHVITIKKYAYEPIIKEVNLIPQEELELTFDLKQSKVWYDSVTKVNSVHRRKRRFFQRVVCTAVGAVCAGATVYFDQAAHRNIDNAEAAAAAYDGVQTGFDELKTQYHDNRTSAKNNIILRDMSAVLTGGTALGFAMTFVF